MEIKNKNNATNQKTNEKPIKNNDEIELVDNRSSDESDEDNQNDQSRKIIKKNEKRGRVFIKNLPFKLISEEELKSSLGQYGEITDVNLPINEKGLSKGFGFIQFKTRREALNAIKEGNTANLKFGGRKINLSLALAKEDYKERENELQIKEEEEKILKIRQEKISKKNIQEVNEVEEESKPKRPLLNDPSRTLFVRNLGYNTDEARLKEFFSNYGQVLYAKIVRDRDTKVSKGTGFVMYSHKEDMDNVLQLYNTHNNNKQAKSKFNKNKINSEDDSNGLNPFELDDRQLYIFQAMSKENAQEMEKQAQKEKNADKRKRELLYYGLSEASIKYFKEENQNISEEDKEKREALINLKKLDFTKNPNLHVSNTRLTIRNLDKNVDEEKLKEIIREKLNEYEKSLNEEERKDYNKVKKIKQIKLLRNSKELDKNDQPKSKCVAFVEVCDLKVAKALINLMSNMKINSKNKKGLILDFSLDDIRKIQTRLNKLKRLQERKKEKSSADNKEKSAKIKKNSNKSKNNENPVGDSNSSNYNNHSNESLEKQKNSIENISDVNVLLDLYNKTVSRGKKQRINKKLKKLGVNPPPTMEAKIKEIDNTNDFFRRPNSNSNDVYVTNRIENEKTNFNKKIQENIKKAKDVEKNKKSILNNKRNRNEEVGEDGFGKNKKRKVEKFEKNPKNVIQTSNNQKAKNKNSKSFEYGDFSDDDDMDEDMNPYYSQILQNLNKK